MTARWKCCHCPGAVWIDLSGEPADAEADAKTVVDHLAGEHPHLFDRWAAKPAEWSPELERALLP